MKLLVTLSLALLIFSGFAFAKPTSSFADNNNNNNGNNNNSSNNHNDEDDDENEDDDKVTICHVISNPDQTLSVSESALRAHLAHGDTQGACPTPPSVPEFGAIPGAIALLTSGGTFFFLKKRFN